MQAHKWLCIDLKPFVIKEESHNFPIIILILYMGKEFWEIKVNYARALSY
jgi:hypothetical protein